MTNMETERLCHAVEEMAETVLKMAEISKMDEEWRKETASAIGLTAELAMRMIASASSGEKKGKRGTLLGILLWRKRKKPSFGKIRLKLEGKSKKG